jgi:putative nucleotidyltransferase with HDIG domain
MRGLAMGAEAAVEQEEMFPIPLAVMQPGTLAPVHLYIKHGGPSLFTLYRTARSRLREEIRERLMARGVTELYLRKKDEKAYYDYVEEHINAIIRDDLLPAQKASQLVYESSSRVMEDTFQDPRSGRNLQRAHTMVEATVLSIIKDPETLWHMTDMASHDYYTYTHCVHVSMFLVTACRDLLGITDRTMLHRIGLGGLFHDIGKSQIPEEVLNKPGKLTPQEFELVKDHPTLGVSIVKRHRQMPHAAVQIIRCHHEHFDGGGYPAGLTGEGISRVSRLSTIIDVYDALTTKRVYAPAREPYAALELMLNGMAAQFDEPILKAFVKFLGPKSLRMELRARWDHALARVLSQPPAAAHA